MVLFATLQWRIWSVKFGIKKFFPGKIWTVFIEALIIFLKNQLLPLILLNPGLNLTHLRTTQPRGLQLAMAHPSQATGSQILKKV